MPLSSRSAERTSRSDAASVVERYLRKLPVPRSLREIGVERDHLREIADAAMADWFITRNPRPVPECGRPGESPRGSVVTGVIRTIPTAS